MPKFRVVCQEEVSTEFFVEAPNRKTLSDWLDEQGPDAISDMLSRQVVHERYFTSVEPWDESSNVDFRVDEEGNTIECESSSAGTESGQTSI
jgi:hypothetical protein